MRASALSNISLEKSRKTVHFPCIVPVILFGHENETEPVGSIERKIHVPLEKFIVPLLIFGLLPDQ